MWIRIQSLIENLNKNRHILAICIISNILPHYKIYFLICFRSRDQLFLYTHWGMIQTTSSKLLLSMYVVSSTYQRKLHGYELWLVRHEVISFILISQFLVECYISHFMRFAVCACLPCLVFVLGIYSFGLHSTL